MHLTHRAANNSLKFIFTSAWIQHYFINATKNIKAMTIKTQVLPYKHYS